MSSIRKPHPTLNRRFLRPKPIIALSGLLLTLAVPTTVVYGKQLSQLGRDLTSTILANNTTLPVYQFVPGQGFTYKLDYTNSSNSDLRALFGDLKASNSSEAVGTNSFLNAFETSVQGELTVTILEQKGSRFLISYTINNPAVTLKANGQEVKAQAQLIQQDLKRQIFATINSQGKILEVRFDPIMSEIAQNFARTLLATTQFVTPNSKTSSGEWTTQEDDLNGQYIARYQAEEGKFQKTKLRYLQPSSSKKPNDSKVPTTINSLGKLTANFSINQGYLISLQGTETQNFVIADKNVGQAKTTLNMAYTKQATLNPKELTKERDANTEREKVAPAIVLSATPTEAEVEAKIQRQELGNATVESLLADLEKAQASPDQNQNNTPLYLKFKALVYLHPESTANLGKRLASADPKSLTMQLLSGALSAVGNESAQSALINAIAARSQDWNALAVLIPSLATVSEPSSSSEETLWNLALNSTDDRISSTVQLALGAMARNLSQTSPERTNKIVDRFVKQLKTANSVEQKRQFLLVLGNSGSKQALGAIAPLIKASAPEVRAAAASALRWIEDDQVDSLLTNALSKDADDRVRLEAAVALSYRKIDPTIFQAQKQAFLSDKAVKVRLALLTNLWKVHEQFPEVRQLVKQAAEKDVSPDVQKEAANIIATYPQGYFEKN
ncbi:HEAT repeat domain-containing protein [Scytonema sp. PRP1]|uniref:HEAT repeat domain-containing protein n=1 Tax=Scytonema sp. PRP1 TaxID=3120513 RepID=UPI00300CA837